MKKLLLTAFYFAATFFAAAQAPTIEGDLMLCPYDEGTATVTGGTIYDSYQWYYKYWFLSDDYVAIDGATEAVFVYDWQTYDQALLKVEVTQGSDTFESNVIQIDSHAWASMTVGGNTENVVFDSENQVFLLCQGGTFENTVNDPYTANIQWYVNDTPIEGATNATYAITEEGTYYVRASPFMCPQEANMANSLPIVVAMNPDCVLSVHNPAAENVALYPNPAKSILNLELPQNTLFTNYTVLDITGKTLLTGAIANTINVTALASGTYILKLEGGNAPAVKKFIKE